MENVGKQLAAEQLQSDNIFLWQVYTDMDMILRKSHIEERAKRQLGKHNSGTCKRNSQGILII